MSAQVPARVLDALVDALRDGSVVACATETQVGLLADARNERAVFLVCALKGRPEGEALGLIAPSTSAAFAIARDVSPATRQLAERYWPGPLTLVLHADESLPSAVRKAGTVAVRVPGPSAALDLAIAFGGVLTATSANLSGQPPLSSEAELRAAFGADVVIGPLNAPGGAPSTIVDMTGATARVLRPGPIDLSEWLRP
jgi:L-threonylcarbamoyladenylate synthase